MKYLLVDTLDNIIGTTHTDKIESAKHYFMEIKRIDEANFDKLWREQGMSIAVFSVDSQVRTECGKFQHLRKGLQMLKHSALEPTLRGKKKAAKKSL